MPLKRTSTGYNGLFHRNLALWPLAFVVYFAKLAFLGQPETANNCSTWNFSATKTTEFSKTLILFVGRSRQSRQSRRSRRASRASRVSPAGRVSRVSPAGRACRASRAGSCQSRQSRQSRRSRRSRRSRQSRQSRQSRRSQWGSQSGRRPHLLCHAPFRKR